MALTNFGNLTKQQKTVWSQAIWQAARQTSFFRRFGLGCDIHLVLERKYEHRWIGIKAYQPMFGIAIERFYRPAKEEDRPAENKREWFGWTIESRNYELFAKLAGVRGDGPDPRGLPEDISDLARLYCGTWGMDGHSHSWGLLSEIGGLFLAHYAPRKILEAERHGTVHQLFGTGVDEGPLEDFRLIYFFDN